MLLFFPFDKSFLSSHTASSLLPSNSTYFRHFSASNKYIFGAKSFSYSCSARSIMSLNTVRVYLSTQDSQVICKHHVYFIHTHYPPRLTKEELTCHDILTLIQWGQDFRQRAASKHRPTTAPWRKLLPGLKLLEARYKHSLPQKVFSLYWWGLVNPTSCFF